MNKKGDLMLWIEIVLFLILFLGVLAIIGSDMNDTYGKNHDLTFGLNLSSQYDDLKVYKSDVLNSTSSGQTTMTDYGVLKITSVPKMLLTAGNVAWSFVNGNFLYRLVVNMHLGGTYTEYVAAIFQILYVVAIGFIFIKLFLKMIP